ncbi:MAG: hypothetical protein ACOY3Y_14905 [Acidobacteriota bacterium]
MKRDRLFAAAVTAAIVSLAVFQAPSATAIPAFARKYQLSCSTCHAPFPRLKPYGEEFAGRGFRMEDPSKEPTRAAHDVGDPLLKLHRELPLAMRLDGYASWKEDAAAEADFEFPWSFKLLSGGPITEKISYYVYAIIEKGESIKLEDTYVQFNSVFGLPVDVLAGQFQVCDPLFKRELRLERNDYAMLKSHVGLSPVALTYDRGLVIAWGAPADVDVIAQVVNGNGIDEAAGDDFDDNSLKNVSLRVARQFGPVRAGVFGYRGKSEAANGPTNTTTYVGPDLVIDLGTKWQLNLEYLLRSDDDPFFVGNIATGVDTDGGFAELHYFPNGQDGRWAVSALYNKVTSDEPGAEVEDLSLTLNYLMGRNFRVMIEAYHDLDADRNRVSFGFVTAF